MLFFLVNYVTRYKILAQISRCLTDVLAGKQDRKLMKSNSSVGAYSLKWYYDKKITSIFFWISKLCLLNTPQAKF